MAIEILHSNVESNFYQHIWTKICEILVRNISAYLYKRPFLVLKSVG